MDAVLRNLIYGPQPTNIFSYHERLLQIVQRVMGPENVRPGFQNLPNYVQFEEEIQFPTGHAISALTRQARSQMSKDEMQRQKQLVRRMVEILARHATPDELARKCLDVSMMICLILEELGIWAVCYMGTLIYEAKQFGGRRLFYYVDDLFEPPANSAARGHSWVFTPAFSLIDLTAKHQPLPESVTGRTPFPLLVEAEDTTSRPEPRWYVDPNDPPPLRAAKKELLDKEGFNREFNLIHRPIRHRGPVDLLFIPMSVTFAPTSIQKVNTPMTFGGLPVLEFCQKVKSDLAAS